MTRQEFLALVEANFPDNNQRLISASKARQVVLALSDHWYNREDDEVLTPQDLPAGVLPAGGLFGEVLTKSSDNNYEFIWTSIPNNSSGTESLIWSLGLGDGSELKLKNNVGVLELRNSTDTDYVDLIVKNLTVQGTQTILNTETLEIEDNIITLNRGVVGSPTLDAGIEINRGSQTKAQLIWDESNDIWKLGLEGDLREIADFTAFQNGNALVWDTVNRRYDLGGDVTDSIALTPDTDIAHNLYFGDEGFRFNNTWLYSQVFNVKSSLALEYGFNASSIDWISQINSNNSGNTIRTYDNANPSNQSYLNVGNAGVLLETEYFYLQNARSSGAIELNDKRSGTNKKGIQLTGFGEIDINTAGAVNYSSLAFNSLVPKKYVDDAISGATISLANGNGTTFNANKVDLGGALSANVNIDGNYGLVLGNTTRLNTFKVLTQQASGTNAIYLHNEGASRRNFLALSPDSASQLSGQNISTSAIGTLSIADSSVSLSLSSIGLFQMDRGTLAITLTDNRTTKKGIEYAADYSAGFTSRSLPDVAWVNAQIANLVNSSPSTLDTLNELATALGNDPNFATTITTLIGTKQPSNANLTTIAGLTLTNDNILQVKSGAWTSRTLAQLKADLNLHNKHTVATDDATVTLDGSTNQVINLTADNPTFSLSNKVSGCEIIVRNVRWTSGTPTIPFGNDRTNIPLLLNVYYQIIIKITDASVEPDIYVKKANSLETVSNAVIDYYSKNYYGGSLTLTWNNVISQLQIGDVSWEKSTDNVNWSVLSSPLTTPTITVPNEAQKYMRAVITPKSQIGAVAGTVFTTESFRTFQLGSNLYDDSQTPSVSGTNDTLTTTATSHKVEVTNAAPSGTSFLTLKGASGVTNYITSSATKRWFIYFEYKANSANYKVRRGSNVSFSTFEDGLEDTQSGTSSWIPYFAVVINNTGTPGSVQMIHSTAIFGRTFEVRRASILIAEILNW